MEPIWTKVVNALSVSKSPRHMELLASRTEAETCAVQRCLVNAFIGYVNRTVDVTTFVLLLLSAAGRRYIN